MYIYIIYIYTSYPRHVGFKWFRKSPPRILEETPLKALPWTMRCSAFPLENPLTRPQDPRSTYSWSPSPQCNCHSTSATPPGWPAAVFELWKNSTSLGALRIFESLFERIELSKRTGSRNLSEALTPLLLVFLVPHAKVIKFHKLEKVCIVSDDSTYNPSFLVRSSNLAS